MTHKHSEYLHWAKTQSRAKYNLATSGVAGFPVKELPFDLCEVEIEGDHGYGYQPLTQAISAYHGIDPDSVVQA